jgi:hypothetical protein
MLSPLGPIAGAFCLDNHEVSAIMGPVGSAKTTAAILRAGRHAFEQQPYEGIARSRFAIVRNTGPQLVDTTMKSWFKLFPTDNKYRRYTSTTKTQTWRFTPKGFKHLVHAEFIFRALDDEDDVANLLSLEVTGFLFNELREINTQILAHAGRRAGRYPGADLGGCTWRGWFGDTNPWAATSDLHEMFVADPRPGYKFFKQPGGMEPDAENLENLEQTRETLQLAWNDPKRREQGRTYYINALRDYNKNDADMFVHCKYGASRDGKPVYPSYDDNVHCKAFELLKVNARRKAEPVGPTTPIKIGYDNTGRNPAAAIAQRTEAGQWRIRHEFIAEGMGMKAHARALHRFLEEKIPDYVIEKITCDPAGAAKDSGELDMRQIVSAEFPGVVVVNARTNDVETRIEAVEGPLRRMVNGEPAVIIHPECKILRQAWLTKCHYRRLKIQGEERYTETPEKITPWSDIGDAVQYLFLGGGEGRVNSDGTGNEPKWPKNGQAVTPKPPDETQKQQRQQRSFDPRTGSVFHGF